MIQPSKTAFHRCHGRYFSPESWLFLVLTGLATLIFFRCVDMTPHVGRDFFFATDDPLLKAESRLSQEFERKDQQLIINIRGDIRDETYRGKIGQLSTMLMTLEGVKNVTSLTQGPKHFRHAVTSPFWTRLLGTDHPDSSNITVFLDASSERDTLNRIEHLITAFSSPEFDIRMSGFPFVTELIRRHLLIDLKTFSLVALVIFGIVTVLIFHSWRIFLGMILTCHSAGMYTFMLTQILNIKVGILTANLATIVFVLTLSHIVFLTFNWRHLNRHDLPSRQAVGMAVRMTAGPSFWCMLTTFLGFISLYFVPARPLKELGVAGSIGTVIAFCVTYGIFPVFLRLKEASELRSDRMLTYYFHRAFSGLYHMRLIIAALIIGFVAISFPSLKQLKTDPSLLSYFDAESDIYQGLERIDREGGSSPLVIVVRDNKGAAFNSNRAYQRLWTLQEDLEAHPETGTIISLATLMAEGKRSTPFFFLYGWNRFFRAINSDRYQNIGRSFITPDYKRALFLIRMNEQGRDRTRLAVIDSIHRIVRDHGFTVHITAGIYALQGRLAQLVASSLVYGITRLVVIFAIIALLVSLSIWTSLAVGVSIALIPLSILGGVALWGIPLDIISAPASNVALGIGVDAVIHLIFAFLRLKHTGSSRAERWHKARHHMGEPILTSLLIIAAGFGIFFFSSFPPTRRFGGAIVGGAFVAAMTALFIFPMLAGGIRLRRGGKLSNETAPLPRDRVEEPTNPAWDFRGN